ncbi:UNVERIFIED_CONTAM: hypothetical protein K2H54_057350 [Gekko kuhli]
MDISGDEELVVLVMTDVQVPMTKPPVTTPVTPTHLVTLPPIQVPVMGAEGGAAPWLFRDAVKPKKWGIFTLQSGSHYDFQPLQVQPQKELIEESGWDEWFTMIEVSQSKTVHMLEETLLDIPRLVA